MTYDCYWAEGEEAPPATEGENYPEFLAANAAIGRFYVSNRAWRWLIGQMEEHGMLADGEMPCFPNPTDFGLTGRINRDDADPAVKRYWEAEDLILSSPPDGPGIARWKLSSNDGWFVTEAEVRSVLTNVEMPSEPIDPDADFPTFVWYQWLVFLHGAAEHGGFLVY